MSTQSAPSAWYPDPIGRYELRYFDGARWTQHVSSGGVQGADPEPLVAPSANRGSPAGTPVGTSVASRTRRQRMGGLMVGLGALMVLSAFLDWATAGGGRAALSGWAWGPGKWTAGLGVLLGLYGAQAFRDGRPVRYHPGAVTIMTITFFITSVSSSTVDHINRATFGIGDVQPGTGLLLTFLAPFVAIWPLVVLWKDYRRTRTA